jgi:hypothetical protein
MKRSALALIGSLMGLMYLAYLIFTLIWAQAPAVLPLQLGPWTVQLPLLRPHALLIAAAVILNWIQWLGKKRGAALASAILYGAAAPLLPEMFAVPVALMLMALAGFFWPEARGKKDKKTAAPEDDEPDLPNKAAPEDPDGLDDLIDLDGLDGLEGSADPDDEPDLALEDEPDPVLDDDADGDLSLDPDPEDEKDEPRRPRADGMAVFLGIFTGIAALALIGIIVYGVMGGKLPFMP